MSDSDIVSQPSAIYSDGEKRYRENMGGNIKTSPLASSA